MAGIKHREMWRRVFRRDFTPESIRKAAIAKDLSLLCETKTEKSVCDSCEPFLAKDRIDRNSAYLEMAKMMPNASSGTLRKLRRRLNLE